MVIYGNHENAKKLDGPLENFPAIYIMVYRQFLVDFTLGPGYKLAIYNYVHALS